MMLLFVLFIGTYITIINGDCTVFDRLVTIKDQKFSYLLDGHFSDKLVKLADSHVNDDQVWMLQPSNRIGLFNLINVGNGGALDLSSTYDAENDSYNATTNTLLDTVSQQWFINGDGSLSNVLGYVLDVKNSTYFFHNYLVVQRRTGDSAKFMINLIY